MVERKKNLESVDSLSKEKREIEERIRIMKRADSEVDLEMAVKKMNSEDMNDQREILDACYDYIAQHRALFKDNFKRLD
jgi:pyruvate-formate lyase-activating enzyme